MTEEILARAMPPLVSEYRLGEAAVDRFQADGHLFCPGLIAAGEIAVFKPCLEELSRKAEDRRQDHYRSFNTWEKSPLARRMVFSHRLAAAAARLLRCEYVQIHQDSIFLKLPGHKISHYHFDVAASPFHAPADCGIRYITCWIPLVDLDPDMGHLEFVRGSHRFPCEDNLEAGRFLKENWQAIKPRLVSYRNRSAGDASFHSGRTLHTGLPNTTDRDRLALAIQYVAAGTRIHPLAADYLESCKNLQNWIDRRQADGRLSAFEARQQFLRRSADARWLNNYHVNQRISPDEPLLPVPA